MFGGVLVDVREREREREGERQRERLVEEERVREVELFTKTLRVYAHAHFFSILTDIPKEKVNEWKTEGVRGVWLRIPASLYYFFNSGISFLNWICSKRFSHFL